MLRKSRFLTYLLPIWPILNTLDARISLKIGTEGIYPRLEDVVSKLSKEDVLQNDKG